jgi:SAM-dependent methyltransferase
LEIHDFPSGWRRRAAYFGRRQEKPEIKEMLVNTTALPVDPAHEWIQSTYDRTAQKYRAQDDEHICGSDYQRLSQALREVTSSFDREIRVLDLGCGTGRYFHCVQNARELVGLDISQQMLDAARNPVRGDEVSAGKVTLVQGDLFSANFPPAHFDFIYCLGVFGNGCGVDARSCARIKEWLSPGGMLMFDATDISCFPVRVKIRKRVAAALYSRLPRSAKSWWMRRAGWPPFFGADLNSVRRTLRRGGFEIEWITSQRSQLPNGAGFKLEVLCRKPGLG